MKNLKPHTLLLSVAMSAVLFAAVPAFAQNADAEIIAEATVPKERLVTRYTDAAGSEAASAALVSGLRAGGDFSYTTRELQPVLNADGTPVLDANGNPTTQLVDVPHTIVNSNGAMGWGNVNISLSLAQALVDSGEYADLESALSGATTTVTNPDGTTTTTTSGGVLAMRADGMGWGAIAKELGFNLGSLISAGNKSDRATAASAAKSERAAKAKLDATAKAERATGKPERIAKVERPSRPEKIDRPQKPERPERPQKPERGR